MLPNNKVVPELIRIKESEFKANMNKDALIQLVKLSLKFMSFQMSNKFYEQGDGFFIWSLPSPCFAEIYIHLCKEISINNVIHALRISLHRVDDTFVLAEQVRVNEKIKSTVEEEINEAKPFDYYLVLSHTDQYSNF